MLLKLVEYHWAEHIDEALLLLGRLDTKTVPLAGGTYLLGLQDNSIEAVIDLRELGLAYILEDKQGVHIGAMTTLQQMVDEPQLKEFAGGLLSQTAQKSASSRLVRNSATIGGTLGTGVESRADLLTALSALNAEVVVRSGSKTQVDLGGGSIDRPGLSLAGVVYKGKQERRIQVHEFIESRRTNELIVEVLIPHPSQTSGTSFMRIGRTVTDEALLNAVAVVDIQDKKYKQVQLAFGGTNMAPIRLSAVERQLEGQAVTQPLNSQELISILHANMSNFRPPSDIHVSGSYRRVSGMSLAYRVLEEAIKISSWRSIVSSERGV